jgi:predicted RNA-binding protein with PIN domain
VKRYTVEVVEIRHVSVTYTVEADTAEEAIDKAAIGETVEEVESGIVSVAERSINSDREELERDAEEVDDVPA